jgi:hypothetical protein
MEAKQKQNSKGQKRNLLAFFSLSLFASPLALGNMPLSQRAKTVTDTDTNKDGSNDGNVDTTMKDYETKIKESVHVSSINVRGSLKDANCIAGTGAACTSKPYFTAGQVDTQFTALKTAVDQGQANSIAMKGFKQSDGGPSNPFSPEGICSNIPSTFGCGKGDFALLSRARESLEFSINQGDPVLKDGRDPQSFLSKIDGFISMMNAARDQALKGFTGALNVLALNPVSGGSADTAKGSGAGLTYDDYNRNNQDGAMGATFGKQQWVGPHGLKDMSAHVDIMNGLDVVDRVSGKSLTLWQRATRRYQSYDLSRAFTLAKTEGARNQALSTRAPASRK